MENIKQLNSLIDQATADTMKQPSMPLFNSILDLINSRVDMPKHCIAGISRRISIKNSKVTQLVFQLLEFICYNNELSLYSQIATKQFLFKISGLLMDKNTTQQTQLQMLRTISCLHKLFLPFQDLLPLFFQFYNGMIKKGIKVPNDYASPYQPKQPKKIYKKQLNLQQNKVSNNKESSNDATLEQIWNKIIIANEIIENANPQDSVQSNPLLLQMMQHIKQAQKTVTKLINQNINQRSMELALAVNDDICITKRRFKDLQRNKKPQPYIPSELASDKNKQKQKYQKKMQQKTIPKKQQNFVGKKQIRKKQQINIMDIDFNPKPTQVKNLNKNNFFDLLDIQPPKVQNNTPLINFNNLQLNNPNNYPLNANSNPQLNKQVNNFNSGFSLLNLNSDNQFTTASDIKQYGEESLVDKITDLSNFKQFFGNKNNNK